MTVYDGIGISRYMKVHDHHMSVYYKYSVHILVMDTDVPGTRTLISRTCVLILLISVPGCCCDWYMLAHPALLFSRLHPAGPPECCTFVAPNIWNREPSVCTWYVPVCTGMYHAMVLYHLVLLCTALYRYVLFTPSTP